MTFQKVTRARIPQNHRVELSQAIGWVIRVEEAEAEAEVEADVEVCWREDSDIKTS
jgi:hypothetical protein